MNISIIDVGSNTVKMNIYKIDNNKNFEMIKKVTKTTRVSEGMQGDNLIKEIPAKRTLDVLSEFAMLSKEYNCEKNIAMATAALRNAKNPEIVTEKAKEMGVDINIISGDKEAYYEFKGVMGSLNPKNCIIIDTGGASSEINMVENSENIFAKSIKTGAVTLTENYFSETTEFENAKEYVKNLYKKANMPENFKCNQIVALGGTVRMIAKILNGGDNNTNGFEAEKKDVLKLCENLMTKTVDEIKNIKGMDVSRADVLKGGVTPLCALIEYTDCENIIFSSSGLREGVLYEFIG